MTIPLLISNIEKEKEIIHELILLNNQLEQAESEGASPNEVRFVNESITSLLVQLELVNNAIPSLFNGIKFYKNLNETPSQSKVKGVVKIAYKNPDKKPEEQELALKRKDQIKFLDSLTRKKASERKFSVSQSKPSFNKSLRSEFIRSSNKLFRKSADKLIASKNFDSMHRDLRKIASNMIIQSYVSSMLFSILLAFIIGIIISIPMFIFGAGILLPLLAIFGFPLIIFLFFLTYPSSQKRTIEQGINQELPFVTIYMSAVATSGIEPSKIFTILLGTSDYPYTQREIKRLMNYINFYGYDLVSALRQSSKLAPSERLSMLFNGLATTITSGGELSNFLNKHADTLLFDYRLEREKYTKIAETFMDIYISILIAAPMIMMILFILLSLTGYASGFLTPGILSISIVSIISLLNAGFLVFLNMKQPQF